jgi:hypothetical protein
MSAPHSMIRVDAGFSTESAPKTCVLDQMRVLVRDQEANAHRPVS